MTLSRRCVVALWQASVLDNGGMAADRQRIRAMQVELSFLDYDWALNDARA